MISVLSETTFQSTAQSALRRIFVNEDPYEAPFAAPVQHRLILFEYLYEMQPPLLDAIVQAATRYDERGFYVSIFDRPPEEEQQQPYHWYIPFSDIAGYQSLVGPLTNVVYSTSGRWGIMGTYEHYGLLGCDATVMAAIKRVLPDLDSQVFEFLKHWEWNAQHFGSVVDWVPNVLKHVYGAEQAGELLCYWHPLHPIGGLREATDTVGETFPQYQ